MEEKALATVANLIKHFFMREVFYLFSGALVIGSTTWRVGVSLQTAQTLSWVWLLLLGTGAYVLGYVLQETACVVGLVTTALTDTPGAFTRLIYKRYTRSKQVPKAVCSDFWAAMLRVYSRHNERSIAELDRIIAFKQLSSTFVPAGLIAGSVLASGLWSPHLHSRPLAAVAGAILLLMSALLLPLNRFKAFQQAAIIKLLDTTDTPIEKSR